MRYRIGVEIVGGRPGCATAWAADVQLRDDPILDETKLSHPRA